MTNTIDAHIHLFDHAGLLAQIPSECIGFCDIPLYKGPSLPGLCEQAYDKYLPYILTQCPGARVLCTAPSFDELSRIWARHGQNLSGFGELKMYDLYKDHNVSYKDPIFLEQVLGFSETVGNLPVYVHWTLRSISDYRSLRAILNKHPAVPVVLCHCGLDQYLSRPYVSYEYALRLASECQSLWLDLSWHGLIWLSKNKPDFWKLPRNKILLGSDFSPHMDRIKNPLYTRADINTLLAEFGSLCDWDNNARRLLRITP